MKKIRPRRQLSLDLLKFFKAPDLSVSRQADAAMALAGSAADEASEPLAELRVTPVACTKHRILNMRGLLFSERAPRPGERS